MMIAMLVAGIACLLAGLLAIGLGIPVNEFSFGNTLILAGAMAICAGLIILSMWAAVRELKNLAWIGSGAALDRRTRTGQAAAADDDTSSADHTPDGLAEVAEASAYPSAPPTVPWQEDAAARDRPRSEAAPPEEPSAAVKSRRNLMFSSASRRERERTQARADPSAGEPQSSAPAALPAQDSGEVPPPTFDNAWPRSERSRSADPLPQRRSGRSAPSPNEAPAVRQPPPATPGEDQPAVTVLKSGVVDGMAYSLYSDGSIEAQMPEGMMRFASIDELRAHLDHRP
jgi:hypothetical protein